MQLRFSILASGSTGNAMIIDNGEIKLLIDAGLSAKKIEKLLDGQGISAKQLDGILVTHEHADHIQGLGVLSRKYDLPIYANANTWNAMEQKIGKVDDRHRMEFVTGESIDLGLLQVSSFEVSHDAAEPVGFCFTQQSYKLSLLTDTGYVSSKIKELVKDSNAIILECNHDIEMLRMGRYPWNVKRRILSDLGHLSNESAAEALTDLISDCTRKVYMAHLSKDHNLIDLARMTVSNICKERDRCLQTHKVKLMDTYEERATVWEDLYQLG